MHALHKALLSHIELLQQRSQSVFLVVRVVLLDKENVDEGLLVLFFEVFHQLVLQTRTVDCLTDQVPVAEEADVLLENEPLQRLESKANLLLEDCLLEMSITLEGLGDLLFTKTDQSPFCF